MATQNVLGAYELLQRAMQQNPLQQQGVGFGSMPNSAPRYGSNGYDSPQGGLLGRLLALQAQQSLYQPSAGDYQAAPPVPPDPNFRQLLRLPSANRTQDAIAAPSRYDDQSSTNFGQPIVSDVTPDPTRPGSQYAQVPLALCGTGPLGCGIGMGLTAGPAILGGTAALLGGATILNSRKRSSPEADEGPDDRTPPKISSPEWRAWHLKQRDAKRRARDIAGRNALTDTEPDYCTNRYDDEKKRCYVRSLEAAYEDFLADCNVRARERWLMCLANGGVPDPREKGEWGTDEGDDIYYEHGR